MRSVQSWRQQVGTLVVFCGVGIAGLLVPPVQAYTGYGGPEACGVVLGPGGSFDLDADVGPCDEHPAITVISASLDLHGHTVFCEDHDGDGVPNGIELRGKGAQIRNGWVIGCNIGVLTLGKGKHSVEEINAYWNWDDGFHVDSPKNTLDSNNAYWNGQDGYHVHGDRTRLNANGAFGNGDQGFILDNGGLGQNQVTGNWAQWNGDEGFDIDTDNNRLSDNSASYNARTGFKVDDGSYNILDGNVAYHNLEGVHVHSANNQLIDNDVSHNRFDGIDLEPGAHDNLVKSNTVENNGAEGIEVDFGATYNTIDHNTSLGNGDDDLEDENFNCDANTWKSNTFGTKNQPCID